MRINLKLFVFPDDAVGFTTNYNIPKPYKGMKPWYDQFYIGMDIIDTELKSLADSSSSHQTSINVLNNKIYSIGDSGGHVADHQNGGGDELSLSGLEGVSITLDSLLIDLISEKTVDSGVIIDAVLIKDGQITVLGDPVSELQVATKQYVDTIVNGLDWQESVISFLDMTIAEPATPNTGDRYINTVTGDSSETTQAVVINYIYEWNGDDWTSIIPDDGFACFNEDDNLGYLYNSGSWGTFSSITTHNALTGLQGGQANEYYHFTATEHTNLISIGATSELANWLDNVVLDTDGGIHFADDVKSYFGGSDDAYIEWDTALNSLSFVSAEGLSMHAHNADVSIDIEYNLKQIDFWATGNGGTNWGGVSFGMLLAEFNTWEDDMDFIIKKNGGGISFAVDAGLDEIIIGSDIDFTDVLLKDDYITGGITLSQSGDADLTDWFTRTSIVGALNQLAENKYLSVYRAHLIHYYDFMESDYDGWHSSQQGGGDIDNDEEIDGMFGNIMLHLETSTLSTDYAKISREGNLDGKVKLGQGVYSLEMIMKVGAVLPATPTNDYLVLLGLTSLNPTPTNQTDGCYFWFDYTNGNFQCTTEDANTKTTTDSGITPVVDTKYVLRVDVNADATEVKFYINDSLVATHTTDIPSAYVGLYAGIYANTNHNAIREYYIDSFYEDYLLTTPR